LDDNKLSNAPRPGTSYHKPGTANKGGNPMMRPMSSIGRPVSGVVRPNSINNRQGTTSNRLLTSNNRTGTSRGTTSQGRQLRLATASLQSLNSSITLNLNDINPKSIVTKKSLAKVNIILNNYIGSY
jgi:hypothetical protein